MAFRFLHTSDWQMGMKGSGLGSAAEAVSRARLESLDRLLTLAEEKGVDAVLAAGDLFEKNDVADEIVEAVGAILRRHSAIPIHAIPGNHDLAGPGSVWNRNAVNDMEHFHLHRDFEPVDIAEGVVLHPCPVKSIHGQKDVLADIPDLTGDPRIHVALAHGHLLGQIFDDHEKGVSLPLDPAHVERSGLDFLALGHWHGLRRVAGADGVVRIAYSGTHEQTHWREREAGYVLLVDIEKKAAPPHLEALRTGALTWSREAFRFEEDRHVNRLQELLNGRTEDILRLSLEGEIPLDLEADLETCLRNEEARRTGLLVDRRGLRILTDDASLPEGAQLDPALELVRKRLAEAIDAAGDDEERHILLEAARLYRRFLTEEARG